MGLTVYLVNESSVLTEVEAFNIAWALNYQAQFHYGRSGWRSDVNCIYLPGGGNARIPAGGAVLHLLDTCDVAGALGYHDEDGNEVAYARVGVKTAQQNGQQPSEVASHELLELATDPNVNLAAVTGDMKRLIPIEVGDPVQGSGYDVGEPEGRPVGVKVANFALPAYFDPNTKSEKVDFRGVLKVPFTIAPQGYLSYLDLTNVAAGWKQQLGAERTTPAAPGSDDRLGRRA